MPQEHRKGNHEGIKYSCDKCNYYIFRQDSFTQHFIEEHADTHVEDNTDGKFLDIKTAESVADECKEPKMHVVQVSQFCFWD